MKRRRKNCEGDCWCELLSLAKLYAKLVKRVVVLEKLLNVEVKK